MGRIDLLTGNLVVFAHNVQMGMVGGDRHFSGHPLTIPLPAHSVTYMTGWRKHDSQQKAKRRGSATVSFKDIQNKFGGQTP
ncbi:hypothetical protein Tco_0305303 [Tanacetum coccineum]